MCSVAEMERCPFERQCRERHPECDRDKCSDENCDYCALYWTFMDENLIIDDL